MVYGRPHQVATYHTLRKLGYTGLIYLVADTTDIHNSEYQKLYGDEVIVFDKYAASKLYDSGDNSGDLRSTMYAANTIFEIAERLGIEYFFIMCDDYYEFHFMFAGHKGSALVNDLDRLFYHMLDFYKSINALSIAFAQTGDFIGGIENEKGAYRFSKRKAMNTLLCSIHRKFQFLGRMNEDVTTYVNLGSRGHLFLTIPLIAISQKDTQQTKKGLGELYADNGTYVKSFFSVLYNPSNVKVSMMNANHKRIHHSIQWKNTTPMILSDVYKKM